MYKHKLKNIIITSLITIICYSLSSCKGNKDNESSPFPLLIEERIISLEQVFTQKMDSYAVLIFSPTCIACKSTIDVIKERYKKKAFDIFFLDYSSISNNKPISNLGIASYQDICISSVPTLLVIFYKEVVGEFVGFEKIRDLDFENIIWA